MDTEKYSVDDLLDNENFLRWVKHPTAELDFYWNNWKSVDPKRAEIINQAKMIILSVDFKKSESGDIDSERIFKRIKRSLQDDFDSLPHPLSNKHQPESTRGKKGTDMASFSLRFFNSWQKTAA